MGRGPAIQGASPRTPPLPCEASVSRTRALVVPSDRVGPRDGFAAFVREQQCSDRVVRGHWWWADASTRAASGQRPASGAFRGGSSPIGCIGPKLAPLEAGRRAAAAACCPQRHRPTFRWPARLLGRAPGMACSRTQGCFSRQPGMRPCRLCGSLRLIAWPDGDEAMRSVELDCCSPASRCGEAIRSTRGDPPHPLRCIARRNRRGLACAPTPGTDHLLGEDVPRGVPGPR